LSSDPANGAVNRSSDGSYFEVQLQQPIEIPKEALNCTLSVEESAVWWTIPNIITNENNKMYITGPSANPEVTSRGTLGFPAPSQYALTIIAVDVSTLSITNAGAGMPIGSFIVGDIFRPDSGTSLDVEYTITDIIEDLVNTKTYTVSGTLPVNVVANNGPFSRLRYNIITNYVITIAQGLYDLNGINQAILRELENAGAKVDPNPLISFSPDEPTQKVEMRINYSTVSVDFTPTDTPREILGFASAVYGPYNQIPISILAPNVAQFNQVNYFLIHSDLTSKGIRFNNNYNQTIAQVLIDVSPGSQIVSRPYNPARIQVPDLAGSKRNVLRLWLTDDRDRRVNTNGEFWNCRLVLRYLKPYTIGNTLETKS
jgi:hypothetical protein